MGNFRILITFDLMFRNIATYHSCATPYGETFINQRADAWQTRYTFSAKEKDEATGYHFPIAIGIGARYYDSDVSVWLSVDPLASWYPGISPYAYCLNNPVIYVDPDGRWVKGAGFFRNLFKSDERILAEDEAAKHPGGQAAKIDGGWRATWYEDEKAHYDNGASTASTFGFEDFLKSERKERKTGVRIFGNGGGPELRPAKKSSYSQDYSDPVMDQKSDWLRRLFRRFKRNGGGDGPQYPPEGQEPEPTTPVIVDGVKYHRHIYYDYSGNVDRIDTSENPNYMNKMVLPSSLRKMIEHEHRGHDTVIYKNGHAEPLKTNKNEN